MSLNQWFNDIPVVTRVLFSASFGFTLLSSFGFLSATDLVLTFESAVQNFQIWRFFTNFFIYSLGLPFLMNMMFLYQYSSSLERGAFGGRTAEYLWFIILSGILLTLIGLWWPFVVLGRSLVGALIYYWSRVNQNQIVSFYFGIQLPAIYLPWALCAFNLLMGSSPMPLLLGIAVGHCYYFFADLSSIHGYQLIRPPQFLYSIMDPSLNINSAYAPRVQNVYGQQGPLPWGRGRRLAD